MQFDLALFLRALGLAFVLEGLCWALFPGGMRRAMASLLPRPESQLRLTGLAAVAACKKSFFAPWPAIAASLPGEKSIFFGVFQL